MGLGKGATVNDETAAQAMSAAATTETITARLRAAQTRPPPSPSAATALSSCAYSNAMPHAVRRVGLDQTGEACEAGIERCYMLGSEYSPTVSTEVWAKLEIMTVRHKSLRQSSMISRAT